MGATIKDIAEKTGLGLATISKYLNGGHVLDKNRIAIEAAIEELNFTVNEFARGLKTNRSKMIGVVIPQLNNIFMTSIITVIEDILRTHGYAVIVCDTAKDEKREDEVIQFLVNKMVDGIILLTTSKDANGLDLAINRNIPVVLIDRKIERLCDRVDMVLVDNFKAAYNSIDYLIKNGHKRIGLIIGPNEIYTSKQRRLGYEAALEANGISVDRDLIINTDFTIQGGYDSMVKLLGKKQVTAVFVTNYEMTLGTILALNDKNIKIPEEMSIIGFDNLQLAQVVKPRLTIVTQPWEEIGRYAAELILRRMKNPKEDEKAKVVTLATELETAESVFSIQL